MIESLKFFFEKFFIFFDNRCMNKNIALSLSFNLLTLKIL